MGDTSPERRSGCGLLGAVFGGKSLIRPRKSPSPTPTPVETSRTQNDLSENDKKHGDRIISRPGPEYKPQHVRQSPASTPAKSPASNPARSPAPAPAPAATNPKANAPARKVLLPGTGLSGELDTMIKDHQRSKGAGNLVRASSGNVMLLSNLGNLRQPGNGDNGIGKARNEEALHKSKLSTGNAVPNKNEGPGTLCRAISTRMDPEELKILGNEDYKNGRFAEALALYDAAISIAPNKASYRSNRSAALTALGKLLDAAFECREAINIDPSYQRAHNRLATLYVRLGEPEKGMYHFKQAGPEADPDAIITATRIQGHLNKCTEAKRQRNWNALLKEIGLLTSAGADSAPMIFALKAEALLKLNRHQEAIQARANAPNFETDECTKFFGPIASASLLVSQAQVEMAEGRFADACSAAERAIRLDANNKEATSVMKRARAVSTARSTGNDHFKAGRYQEACIAYGEGLEHAPYNSLLLSNRAACQAKLSNWEKALEDCNAALKVRPAYSKARLRRADCYAKMENWGACLRDCEVLIGENPDDGEAARMLNEAKTRLKQQ